jgi:uncharacterized protein (TIGR03437 family)
MRFLILLAILATTACGADFTTYIGPAGVGQSGGVAAIATDSAGNTYVTGSHVSYNYVTGVNAFVTKLDSAGNIVSTVSLGTGYANAIALDSAGNIWVGGQDLSTPLVNPLQSTGVGNGVGSLVKMAPDGTVLYSSYFGGTLGNSGVNGIATDQSGNVYVTGFTAASDFPTTVGLPATPLGEGPGTVYGLFAAKLNSTGQKILYSTVIAGAPDCASCFVNTPSTVGAGIAIDGAGNALVVGNTNTAVLVTATGGSGAGAFVFKINAAGDQLVYFTYVGASVGNSGSPDTASASPITADASGNAYVAGQSNNQGFATKLSPSGTTVWSTPLGGPSTTTVNAISLDSSDNVWLTATTGTRSAPGESFVDELSADGSDFLYSEEFPAGEAGRGIAVDQSGEVHFAGSLGLISTIAEGQPLAPRALSIVNAGSGQLTGTIAGGEVVSIYGLGVGPTTPMAATPVNGFFPTSLGGVQVLVNGNAIPLLYVSASQVNAEIPSSVDGGRLGSGIAVVQVMNNSAPLPDFRLAEAASVFGAFYSSGAYLAVTNQDGTVNSETNPAKAGSYVSLWATGFGSVTGVTMDGAVATVANNYCSSCLVTFSSYSYSVTETVQYAGPSPGLIDGLMQINVMIPAAQSPTPQLQVSFSAPGTMLAQLLGFVWVLQ